MKKLRKLKDGGAVGSGVGGVAAGGSAIGGGLPKGLTDQNLSKASIRPWIFENHRRLARADFKIHELEYMDLTQKENQLINQTRVRKILQQRRQDDKNFRQPEEVYKGFSGGGEMVSDGSDGTVDIEKKSPLENLRENPAVGAALFLAVFLIFAVLFL